MIELRCPYCKEYHEIPEDCEYGGEWKVTTGTLSPMESNDGQ